MLKFKQVALTYLFSACTAVLLSSCASPDLRVTGSDRRAQTVDNVVCDHQFTSEQLAFSPNYSETEFNVVISGNSEMELVQALDSELPFGSHGRTRWKIDWQFDFKPILGGCHVADVRSDVQVVYQLPLWPDQILTTNKQLAENWVSYSDALRNHYCAHGKFGIDASVAIKKQLASLQPSTTCAQAEASANALVRSIIDSHKQAEARLVPPAVSDYLDK